MLNRKELRQLLSPKSSCFNTSLLDNWECQSQIHHAGPVAEPIIISYNIAVGNSCFGCKQLPGNLNPNAPVYADAGVHFCGESTPVIVA